MKPPIFEYHAPESLGEALEQLAELGPQGAKVLAGGQSLMPMLSMRLARPSALIDVNRVPGLDDVRRENGTLAVGALTRHATAESSADVASACPLLACALPQIGHPSIRHRGTLGGSIAHADPGAELPAVATALGATMVVQGPRGRRDVTAEDFFANWFTTTLADDELLTELRFPAQRPDAGSAVLEVARRHGDFALVGVATTLAVAADGTLADVRVVSFATGPTPRRLHGVEELLEGRVQTPALLREASAQAEREVDPASDVHGSAAYRRAALGALVRRSVEHAAQESLERQA